MACCLHECSNPYCSWVLANNDLYSPAVCAWCGCPAYHTYDEEDDRTPLLEIYDDTEQEEMSHGLFI